MSNNSRPSSHLLWKFIASEWHGAIWWRWEVWTQVGDYVASSVEQFENLTDCERDAQANGFVAPEKRR